MKKKLIQRMTFVKTPIFSKKYYETKKTNRTESGIKSTGFDQSNY